MKKTLSKLFVVLKLLTISLVSTGFKKLDDSPNKLYMVYLDGQKLGAIEDKEELFNKYKNMYEKLFWKIFNFLFTYIQDCDIIYT